ncbi:MAG: TonB-dependent receptor, partial [Bacteroidales bacterium]|nr:TonB-dependent receptor [Bacteroidales bacterium]
NNLKTLLNPKLQMVEPFKSFVMSFLKKHFAIICLAIIWQIAANAAINDSIYSIPEIEIRSDRFYSYLIGSSVQQIDSQILNTYNIHSVAEILNRESLLSVNIYGPGGVATASCRGGGAQHTSVIWNGINLQSPMNGGINYSTLPVFLIDEVYIQYGGASTLFGSGTATGSIHLNNSPLLNSGLRTDAAAYIGSGNNFIQSIKISHGNENIASITKFYHQGNQNNFRYRNTELEGSPYENLEHANYEQYALSHSNTVRTGKNSWIGIDLWFVDFDKNIPAMMNADSSNAAQKDRNAMYSFYFKYAGTKLNTRIQSGGFYNENHYEDPDFLINTLNRSYTFVNLAEFKYSLIKQLDVGLILEQKHERANSDSYTDWKFRDIFTPVLSVWYRPAKNLSAILNVREEIVSVNINPLAFSFGIEYNVIDLLTFKTHISKNYSLPTFNDLYWERDAWSEGNPDLKPESGWSTNAGTYLSFNRENIKWNYSIVGYYSYIDNWIRWVSDESYFWTPQNIQEGESKGIEIAGNFSWKLNKINITGNALYGYTKAIIKKWDDMLTENAKMWYMPEQQVRCNLGMHVKHFGLNYSHSAYGSRTYPYAEEDLPAYGIADLTTEYGFTFNSFDILLFLRINNLYNKQYQIKEFYAMPLREYSLGITFSFKK